jgi:hypothetical protein
MAKDHVRHVGSQTHNVFRSLYSLPELDVPKELEALVMYSLLHLAPLPQSNQASLST